MKKEPEILDFFGIPIGHFPDRSTRWLFQNKDFVQDLLEILASELVECIDFDRLSQINRSFITLPAKTPCFSLWDSGGRRMVTNGSSKGKC